MTHARTLGASSDQPIQRTNDMSSGKFHVRQDAKGEFRFHLVAANGEEIMGSEGYTARASCLKGIESVKHHSLDVDNYERTISASGRCHFNLRAKNGGVIGTSQSYGSSEAMEKGIGAVMRIAPEAVVTAP